MINCPSCGAPVAGPSCQRCGYAEPGAPPAARRGYDREAHGCQHERAGQRCANAGSFSPSTTGGGPYFCWQHAVHVHGGDVRAGPRPKRPAGLERLDAEAIAERLAIQQEAAEWT